MLSKFYLKIKKDKIQIKIERDDSITESKYNDDFKKLKNFLTIKNQEISRRIEVILTHQKFNIIPAELSNNKNLIYNLCLNNFLIDKGELLNICNLLQENISIVFTIQKQIFDDLSALYFPQKINFVHIEYLILNSIINDLKLLKYHKPTLSIYLENKFLHITLIKQKRIIYHNKFQYLDIEKGIHYILLIAENFKFDISENIIIWGEATKDHEIIKSLNYYFKNISLKKIKI
ncbi:MAG: DUF3822 family protein [Bacteroidetes bacterium]|nr:DUF3822 family protein [Bacteroidota bacterium]